MPASVDRETEIVVESLSDVGSDSDYTWVTDIESISDVDSISNVDSDSDYTWITESDPISEADSDSDYVLITESGLQSTADMQHDQYPINTKTAIRLFTAHEVDIWRQGGDAPCTTPFCPIKIPHNNGRCIDNDTTNILGLYPMNRENIIHYGPQEEYNTTRIIGHPFFGTCNPPPAVWKAYGRFEGREHKTDVLSVLGFLAYRVRVFWPFASGRKVCDHGTLL